MENCFSDSTLLKFLSKELDTETCERVNTHIDQCSICQNRIEKHSEDEDLKQWQQSYHRQQNDEYSERFIHSEDRINRIFDSTISSIHQSSLQVTKEGNPATQNKSILTGKEIAPDSSRIIGQYQLIKKIGQGGMGVVFLAVHTRLKKQVVLKILLNKDWDSSNQTQRFYREMELVGQLDHPNIVKATDAGEADDICYLAMEALIGHDLKTILKSEGALPITAACTIVRQVANGLQYIHNHNLIHRDIKPSNLFLTHDGQIKILDLGLAGLRYTDSSNEDLTQSDCIMGSVNYMAPEQAKSIKHIDHRSDIYSLGCTFYQLLTDRVLFRRETPVETIIAHREAPVPLLSSQIPEIPEQLENLFQSMVKKQPDDRIPSMSEIVKIIDQYLEQQNNKPINDESNTRLTDTQELREICHNVELSQPVEALNNDFSTQFMPTQSTFHPKKVLLIFSAMAVFLVGLMIYGSFPEIPPIEKPEIKPLPIKPLTIKTLPITEHDVATWALKNGCIIDVQIPNYDSIKEITQTEGLPDGEFHITSIIFTGAENKSPHLLTSESLTPLQNLSKLKTLQLFFCQIEDDALDAIKNLSTLTTLDLQKSKLTDNGLAHIRSLKNLEFLSIQFNPDITDDGLQVLNELQNLKSVNLAKLNISDKGVTFLKNNPMLEWINISYTQVSDESVNDLKNLNRLRELYLEHSDISDEGVNEIRAAFKDRDPIK